MADQPAQLMLRIDASPGAEDEERGELARQLRQELCELDVNSVDFARAASAPARAKGDPVTLGTLLVTLAASGGVLTTLINAVQSWLARQERTSVTLEIGGDKLSITGVSSEEQRRLIAAWLRRQKAHENLP